MSNCHLVLTEKNFVQPGAPTPQLSPLTAIVDRPLVQHTIESAAQLGIKAMTILTSTLTEELFSLFEDGRRWGIELIIKQASDESEQRQLLLGLANARQEDCFLISNIFSCPIITGEMLDGDTPKYFHTNGSAFLISVPRMELKRDMLGRYPLNSYRTDPAVQKIRTGKSLSILSPRDLLAAQQTVLSKANQTLLHAGLEVSPENWLARSIRKEDDLVLDGPLFIGPFCYIGKGVQLGQNTVLGEGCYIDNGAKIANSYVPPYTYIGAGTVVQSAVIQSRVIYDTEFDFSYEIDDPALLSDLKHPLSTITTLLKSQFVSAKKEIIWN